MLIKTLAERCFLSRKVSKRVSSILRDCPDIGEQIETFVKDCNVRACRFVAAHWYLNI